MCDVKSQVVQTIQFPVFSIQGMSEYVSVYVWECVFVSVRVCGCVWECV